MKWLLPAILLSLTCCHEQAAKDRAPAPAATASAGISARVVGIHDGDSLTVLIDGKQVKVRLEGIDAPEKGQAFGAKSKAALAFLLAGHAVRIAPTGRDRYGRTLARVKADGADVAACPGAAGWSRQGWARLIARIPASSLVTSRRLRPEASFAFSLSSTPPQA